MKTPKNPDDLTPQQLAAAILGSIGGKRRMASITPEERKVLASEAGKASGEARRKRKESSE